MINYQVDECLDSKKLVKACAAEGLVQIRRCPARLKQYEDPEVLQDVLPSDWTLLTTDRSIHLEHSEFIPNEHSGIVIIATCRSPRTLRLKDTVKILRDFKTQFPEWHAISLRNSIVEITEEGAEVWQAVDGAAERIGYFHFETEKWQEEFSELLNKNASKDRTIEDK